MKTSVYIDGFNFYYGVVKNTPYKWIDFKKLCANLLQPQHQITSIKYFTALVSGRTDPDQPTRQTTFIRALETYIPEISVHYGQFVERVVRCKLATPIAGQNFADILKTEEKGSDVNLAVHLINDAWLNAYDCAIILSNDSDLAEALKLVRAQNKKVGIFIPAKARMSRTLQQNCDFIVRIRQGVLRISQLPSPIPNTNIHKPAIW